MHKFLVLILVDGCKLSELPCHVSYAYEYLALTFTYLLLSRLHDCIRIRMLEYYLLTYW